MSTKAPGEILELFRGGYLSMAETIDALDAVEGYVSVELLNIERAISDDLREQNAKLREAAATPAVGGETVAVPKAALDWLFGAGPDSEGLWFGQGLRDHGSYWWRSKFRAMISAAPPALRGREQIEKAAARLIEFTSVFDVDANADDSEPNLHQDVETLCTAALSASPPEQPAADHSTVRAKGTP